MVRKSQQPEPPPKLPDEIGGYRVQRVLGAGGMATVYAALQAQPRRTVALKVIKHGVESPAALHRFKREVEILGKLRHPNIAQVYHAGTYDDGTGAAPYFVMEYVPGAKTIHDYAESHSLSIENRLKLFVAICAAIDHGHKNKVIHRDLKPSNLLVDENGVPKVIDFGIARSIDTAGDDHTVHTEAGNLVGTIHYMAPEQLRNEPVDLDARCDVYALGAVLYKLLTRRPPYELAGLPLPTAALVVMEDEPVPPSLYKADLKGDLETILLKALEKERARRYRSAGSLGRDILRFLRDQPIHARPITSWHKFRLFMRRHRTAVIAAVISSVMVIVAGVSVIQMIRHSSEVQRQKNEELGAQRDEFKASLDRLRESTGRPVVPEAPLQWTAIGGHSAAVTSLAFNPSGGWIASGCADNRTSIWGSSVEGRRYSAQEHDSKVIAVQLTSDGLLVSVAADGTITRVRESTNRIEERNDLRVTPIEAAVSADGNTIVASCDDLTVRMLTADDEVRVLRGITGAFQHVAVAGDGSTVAASTPGGEVYVWNGEGRLLGRVEMPDAIAIGVSADGQRIAVVSASGDGLVWSLESELKLGVPFDASEHPIVKAVFDPTGRYLVTVSDRRELVVIDTAERKRVGESMEVGEAVSALAVASDGSAVAVGYAPGQLVGVRFRQPGEVAPDDGS